MLTRKQFELLRFIHERLKEAGVPPSFDEMKDALDLRSKSGIHRLITALEERGFIRRLPNRARAIEVIKLPESVSHGIGGRARGFTPSVIEGNLGRGRAAPDDDGGRPIAVPVMGRIAAGTPIEAIQSKSAVINMPPDMLSVGEHFALEVRGNSMIEAGILDGDMALIKKTETADTGDIVVALDRRRGSDAEAFPSPRRLDRARTREHLLRGAHPAAKPRAHPGQAGRAVPSLLSGSIVGVQIVSVRRSPAPRGSRWPAVTRRCCPAIATTAARSRADGPPQLSNLFPSGKAPSRRWRVTRCGR